MDLITISWSSIKITNQLMLFSLKLMQNLKQEEEDALNVVKLILQLKQIQLVQKMN